MSLTLIQDVSQVAVGLVTYTFTIPTTGIYRVTCALTEIPPSGLSVTVLDGVTTLFTAPTIGQSQIAQQFTYSFLATAADVITVVLASSSAIDKGLESVKSQVSITAGL